MSLRVLRRVSGESLLPESPVRSPESVPQISYQECSTRVSRRVSRKSAQQKCLTRVSPKSLTRVSKRVSHNSILQECRNDIWLEGVKKTVLQECLPRECPTTTYPARVSLKNFQKAWSEITSYISLHKSLPQECAPQECSTQGVLQGGPNPIIVIGSESGRRTSPGSYD